MGGLIMEKLVHNLETNQVEVVAMSVDEIAELEKMRLADEAKAAEAAAEAAAKEAARQALLDKLGITADEAQLLLGSN